MVLNNFQFSILLLLSIQRARPELASENSQFYFKETDTCVYVKR